jgi:hypothetical protein
MMPVLEILDGTNVMDALNHPIFVLVLAKKDCVACQQWGEELTTFLSTLPEDSSLQQVRFGKLILDQPGLRTFKKASPWLAEVNDLPYNAIYQDGAYVRGFLGSGTTRLVNRINRLLG